MAAAIQQSLLPPAGRDGAFFTTAGASIPCRAVGGDFSTTSTWRAGNLASSWAMWPGKALQPRCSRLQRWACSAPRRHAQPSAAPLLVRLNRGLFRRSIEARFLTTFYGILGTDGSLTYSNGGHNAPVLLTNNSVRRLETGGVVLGLFEHASYDEETVSLNRGDVIIAFSDGVSEALNETGDEFTDERLLDSIAAHRGKAPQELLDGVVADVRARFVVARLKATT